MPLSCLVCCARTLDGRWRVRDRQRVLKLLCIRGKGITSLGLNVQVSISFYLAVTVQGI